MKLLTIKPNIIQNIFSYIKDKRKLKIVKYNKYLNKK